MASPYNVTVRIQYPAGTALADIKVTVRQNATNESYSKNTNSDGDAIFNLGSTTEFPSGWTIGDSFTIIVLYQGYEAYYSHAIATGEGGYAKTIVLSAVPSAPSLKLFRPQEFLDTLNLKIYEDDAVNGVKLQQLTLVGESVETELEEDCNTKFDNNLGNYYTQTDYFDDISDYRVFSPTKRPIVSITSLHYNTSREGSADSWSTDSLVENTDFTLNPDTNSIRISRTTNEAPEDDRKRGWRLIYTYGRLSVPADIKLLAIYETAVRLGLSAVVKSKIGGHDNDSEDFNAWFNRYRNRIIQRYRNQSFENT
ncbi:MAG: hypothetical protein ACTSX6_04805 [Candidatus Heimdallarchaeaceae archaeon]